MAANEKELVNNVVQFPQQNWVLEFPAFDKDTEFDEWTFTNDKTNPAIRGMWHLFHSAAFNNKLGLMHSRHIPSGTIHTLIVGVEQTTDGVHTWPLARVLTEDEQGTYEAPDGEGGFC